MALAREIRLCRDCKHYRYEFGHECYHPSLIKINVISGNKTGEQPCNHMRGPTGKCKINGELWEPKPLSLWQRFVKYFSEEWSSS